MLFGRYCQERLAAEEILREIDFAVWRARQVGEIQGRHRERCPHPFGVGAGDDRRIDPEKPVLVEEAVDRFRQGVAHPRRRADHIGARPQMGDFAQVFHGVRLRLDWAGVRVLDPADHAQRGSPEVPPSNVFNAIFRELGNQPA